MNYENWIGYRYLRASLRDGGTEKGKFLSFLHFVSVAGVAIGVMALIIVIGVMTGFGNNLRDKIIGTTPHVVVEKESGIRDYGDLQDTLAGIEGVMASSAYIQGNVFLEDNGHAIGQMVRGILPETEENVTKVREYLVKGSIGDLNGNGIIIGSELARYFGYALGDQVTLISPGSGMEGRGWRYQLTVVGIFNTGMVDYDTNLALVNLKKAQEIFGLPQDRVTGIGVKIEDPYQAGAMKNEIHKALGYRFLVKTWIDANRNLFEALFLEKWGLFIILTLMVIVASFNIVSTLMVMVTSKIHDIGILKSFGVTQRSIRRIFTKQGVFIGLVGTFWGLVFGVGISYILKTYVKVPQEIYSIDRVPVDLQFLDILIIVSAAMIISFLASIYPAAKAAGLQPVDALRYE